MQGTSDEIVTPDSVDTLAAKLRTQKAITVEHTEIKGGNHFFEGKLDELSATVDDYMRRRLASGE